MKLVFATNNLNKLSEVISLVKTNARILSLDEIGCSDDIPETFPTIEENALQKAEYIYNKFGLNCLADDSALEIDFLNGEPGVYSARYAGTNSDANKNIDKVLQKLSQTDLRGAKFRTVIALILNGKKYLFEGECLGQITQQKQGKHGFGYDPIFLPDGFSKTFAEMSKFEKGKISHRSIAVKKLISFINSKIIV